MKKIVASVGLAAIGASSLQLACAQSLSGPAPAKPWSVSATLRGFYDDNINALPDNYPMQGASRESLGYEVSPSAAFAHDTGPTTLSLGYTYSMKYFENQPIYTTSKITQTHLFDAALTHAFNERYNVAVRDSFAIGQEPDVLRYGNAFTTFQPVSGNNIRNIGSIIFDAELTRQAGLEMGYSNALLKYDDNTEFFSGGLLFTPSLAATSDNMAQTFHIDGRWHVQPQTTAVLGYQYGMIDYTADQLVYQDPFTSYLSDVRNSRSHYGYVGADHQFSPDLNGSARVGVRYTDFYNDPSQNTELGPYVMLNLRYAYRPDSYASIGFTYDLSSTDLVGFTGDSFTSAAETANVFASVHHRLAQRLTGSVVGQFQNSSYLGGIYDGETEQFLVVGFTLEYEINRYLAAQAGYNFDKLFSDLGRGFDRNRVYIGLTARY